MTRASFRVEGGNDDRPALVLAGDWTSRTLGRLPQELKAQLRGRTLHAVDISELGRFDTAGALAIVQAHEDRLPKLGWQGRPEVERMVQVVEELERHAVEPPRKADVLTRFFARVGRGVYDFGAEAWEAFAFLGELLMAVLRTLANPAKIRWAAWFSQADHAGLDAIPIVLVTTFFIGAVVAFIGADLLTDFGAGVFAVQLIGVAVFREFAVVITAVLLAGRSASSFAAEIGSMKMNQEVDAMRVMGVEPFQALVVPRLAALVLMLPLLTFLAMVSGLVGGIVVTWSQLNLGPSFFLQRLVLDGYMPQHMLAGMVKAPVFAIVVATIGCRQGMAVGGDVESLGKRVTAAVVQAIFAIIALDAVFALLFMRIGL
ncbi:MAG TPA: MlaE family lipid ABC transporter permease subunit [Brevundimonas sp.]|uniref:ABC transporter permease n=1 Tax=Brevundimonas sp. TaxID=1871086 RepID=UPI002CA86CB2|nr:MlaE family lipid ABC transporter permease subunit [Brevundimonas sp.]HRH19358.1 MlaE family lipid ABC transporter permease subunit [Brevundimonas sp.]